MVQSKAATVAAYLNELPVDRREAIAAVRAVILENLAGGFEEIMDFGMIAYVVPLDRYPKTYNKKPLMYAALASQKNHMAVYLMCIYSDDRVEDWFTQAYAASGRKLDMGKSCVRFKKLDDLPLDVVGEAIARMSVDDFIASYEIARGMRG